MAGFRLQETPVARLCLKRHRFPADVIRHAVWLYFRLTLSFRAVEELLAQRGISVSHETVRCWTIKFGLQIAAKLRHRGAAPSARWQRIGRLSVAESAENWSSQDFVDTLERLEKRAEEVSNVQESHPLGYPKDLRVHFCASQVL